MEQRLRLQSFVGEGVVELESVAGLREAGLKAIPLAQEVFGRSAKGFEGEDGRDQVGRQQHADEDPHGDARIAKVLGGNFARVMGEVWG